MPPFHFRLEQVLRYRKQLEEQAMQALAQARMHLDTRKRQLAACYADLHEQQTALLGPAGLNTAERWLISGYCEALRQDIDAVRADIAILEEEVDRRQTVLIEKAQERKLLEKLKTKQAERHAKDELYQEQNTYDEIATLRFAAPTS